MSGCRRGSRKWKRHKQARRRLHGKAAAERRHQRRGLGQPAVPAVRDRLRRGAADGEHNPLGPRDQRAEWQEGQPETRAEPVAADRGALRAERHPRTRRSAGRRPHRARPRCRDVDHVQHLRATKPRQPRKSDLPVPDVRVRRQRRRQRGAEHPRERRRSNPGADGRVREPRTVQNKPSRPEERTARTISPSRGTRPAQEGSRQAVTEAPTLPRSGPHTNADRIEEHRNQGRTAKFREDPQYSSPPGGAGPAYG